MDKFELVAKPGKIALAFALAVGAGFLGVLVTYGVISRFSNWTATRIMPIALGIGAVVAVAVGLNTLFNTIKRIEVDGQALRIQLLSGAKKEYLLGQNQFIPKVTHQTNRGQHVGTTRALQVDGPHGTDTHTIAFSPEEFNELVNRLIGRSDGIPYAAGQASAQAQTPQQAHVQGPPAARRPLEFQPQRFEITRKPLLKLYVTFSVLAAVMLAFGVLAALGSASDNVEPFVPFAVLGGFVVLALLVLLPVLVMRRRATKLPKHVVVAPTWVSFDDRTFNYADLKVIQIKPAGTFMNRSAKILTRADERVVHQLGIGTYRKMFPDYDQFAQLLEQAGTAAAGVVRIDWS